MKRITSHERVIKTLNHEEADRVPLFYRDIPEVEKRLLRDLNLKNREELLSYLDIDFRWVGPKYIGPSLKSENSGYKRDIWGVEYKYVQFDESSGYWEVVEHPLSNAHNKSDLDNYTWPSIEWFDFSQLKYDVEKYDEFAIMTNPGYSSPSIFQCPIQTLLGDEKSFIDILINPEFIDALIQKVLDFQLPFIERMLEAANNRIDFFRIGDDFASQDSLLISPDLWRKTIKPALKAMVNTAKKYNAYIYLHSCGAICDLIPDFIDIGVDVLDPIQVTANGMDPYKLKSKYGKDIVFSGGVDEQYLLREGTKDDIRKNVIELLNIMACECQVILEKKCSIIFHSVFPFI